MEEMNERPKLWNNDTVYSGGGDMLRTDLRTQIPWHKKSKGKQAVDLPSQIIFNTSFTVDKNGRVAGTLIDHNGKWNLNGRMTHEGEGQYSLELHMIYKEGPVRSSASFPRHLAMHGRIADRWLVFTGKLDITNKGKVVKGDIPTSMAVKRQYEGFEVVNVG